MRAVKGILALLVGMLTISAGAVTLGAVSNYTTKPQVNNTAVAKPIAETAFKFAAEDMADKVSVNWSIGSQVNTNFFVLDRSTDGNNWTEIYRVKGAEQCSVRLYYEAYDLNAPKELCFYRLRTQYLDGTEEESAMAAVDRSNQQEYLISYARYEHSNYQIVYSGNIDEVSYQVWDKEGNEVNLPTSKENNKIIIDLRGAPEKEYKLLARAKSGKVHETAIWVQKKRFVGMSAD